MALTKTEVPQVAEDDQPVENPSQPQSYSKIVWGQFKKNKPAMGCLILIGMLTLIALGADLIAGNKPYYLVYRGNTYYPAFRQYAVHVGDVLQIGGLTNLPDALRWPKDLRRRKNFKKYRADESILPLIPYDPKEVNLQSKYQPPNEEHWLGTDRLGRDVLSGLIHGTRYALTIGLVSVGISLLIGVFLGSLAGYFGGWVDLALSRLFELWSAIPGLLLIITASAFFPPSLFFVMMIIGLTGWVGIARLTRSQFFQVRSNEYVAAARALGYSYSRIMFVHILPNAIAPVLVPAAFGVAGAILAESGLSFLGVGVPAESITWGAILAGARSNFSAWWLVVVPGMAIFITVTMYNLLGDGLRDALDPKMKVD
jgi:peptide/nickel transport system permease protein